MLQERLAALEGAAQPYINAGYAVMGQTDSSLTLVRPRPRFSILIFIVLLVVLWPTAIIYSAFNRSRRDRMVCLRITSLGYIEATGDLLEDGRRRVSSTAFLLIVLASVVLTALPLILILR